MNVVDSSGWIEYFTEGGNADFFTPSISQCGGVGRSNHCIYEVFKRLLAERDEDSALLSVGPMSQRTRKSSWTAISPLMPAQISREMKLAMADSIYPCHCPRSQCHALDPGRALQRVGRREIYREERLTKTESLNAADPPLDMFDANTVERWFIEKEISAVVEYAK